jgi:hypothetical protein
MNYFISTITKPAATIEKLIYDGKKISNGFRIMLLMVSLYTVAIYFLSLTKTPIEFDLKPFLRIPDEQYYKWETLMIALVILAAWILTSAIIYLACKGIGGKSSFDNTLVLIGYSIAIPSYLTLISDGITGALSAIGVLNQVEWNKAKITPGTVPFFCIFGLMLIQVYRLLFYSYYQIRHSTGR